MTAPIDNALVQADAAEARGDLTRLSATQTDALTRARLRLMNGDETAALAVDSILDLRVTMPIYRLADAQKVIARLGKRAEKRGLPVPTIEEVARDTRDDASEWVTVKLLGAAPVLNDWTCVATVMPGVEAPITYRARGEDTPDIVVMQCNHCNIKRRRTMTFLLRHIDGRLVQVGKTCLNEYLGVEALATWFVWCELQERAAEFGSLGWDSTAHAQWLADNAAAAARRDKTPWKSPDLRTFLSVVAAHVRVHGYEKSTRNGWGGSDGGTGRAVFQLMREASHEQPVDSDIATADGVIAWLNELARDANNELSYATRHLDAIAQDGVSKKIANTIASVVPRYLSARARPNTVERLNEILPNVQPGETIEITLTVERSLSFALQCADERGRCVLLRSYYPRHSSGASIRVRGDVQSMTIFNGTRQTILDRAVQIEAH